LLKDIRFIQDQNLDVNEFRWFTQNICGDFAEDGTVIDHIDEIVFEQVSYQYANSPTYAVKDVNVTIRRSSKIAVVGENGAGKTTFVKLLLGLYTPTSGRILVNGMDMATINKSSFYKCMASVFQDFHILAFSIAENISLSEDKSCAGRVEQILEQVGLLSRIQKLPKAIDTPASHAIEDEGIELSGGEGQRVALARALYTGASWYVLDEPSAALDPLAERNLYTMFAQTMEGRTMLFVSHRLASTTLCDEILFFSQGVIAERGSHEELMGLGGGYAALYEAQARFYREGQTATERD
jgi:ATP-binding cassette subfamily B protein